MRNTAAILNDGMNCLLEKLGVIETEIFISHILREPFNYTTWQKEHYAEISVHELNQKAMEYAKSRPFKPAGEAGPAIPQSKFS
jgi:hypothetical protein